MNELIMFATPMLALAGLACGWTAEAVSPAGGFGLRSDMALGVAGSVALAIVLHGLNGLGGMGLVAVFGIGVTGAAIVLVGQRALWRSPALLR